MLLPHFGSHSWFAKWKCFITRWFLKVCFCSHMIRSWDLWSWISFCRLVFMGCWGMGYSYCYRLSLMCLEDLRWLGITRWITDVWLFHWKILLAMKATWDWKYTRGGHCFSSCRDNHYFQSHRDFTNALTILFLPTIMDILITGMNWSVHVPVCFK